MFSAAGSSSLKPHFAQSNNGVKRVAPTFKVPALLRKELHQVLQETARVVESRPHCKSDLSNPRQLCFVIFIHFLSLLWDKVGHAAILDLEKVSRFSSEV